MMLERIKRLWRHRWLDERSTRRIIDADVMQRLTQRVTASEHQHLGEIRLCIEAALPTSYLLRRTDMRDITRQRALTLFGKLRVWDTEHNNGVLIYLLLAEHGIEIIADRGLTRMVAPAQWQAMIEVMRQAFVRGDFEGGLTQAIDDVHALLVHHFPRSPDLPRRNELPDVPELR